MGAPIRAWDTACSRHCANIAPKVVELDPDYSAAYAAAAMCFSRRKGAGWVIDREQEVAEARRLGLRAVQSGKDDATVLCQAGHALAYVARDLDAMALPSLREPC